MYSINRGLEAVHASGFKLECQLTSNKGGLESHDSLANSSRMLGLLNMFEALLGSC